MTTLDSIERNELPWYKQFWPWFLIALPSTAVIASLWTMSIALNNPHVMVHDNYYKEGLAINKSLIEEENSSKLLLSASVRFVTINKENTRIIIRLSHIEEYQSPEQIQLHLIHPANNQKDLKMPFTRSYNGDYISDTVLALDTINQNRWYVHVSPLADSNLNKIHQWKLKGSAVLSSNAEVQISHEDL